MKHHNILQKIENRTARVGIIGLGYVGLPLAVEFAKAGFVVTGFDLDPFKIKEITEGRSYIPDVPTEDVASLVESGHLSATTVMAWLEQMDTVTICVPTPLKKTKDPDMSYIMSATETLARHMHPGMLVTLESTTYPGTTEELVLPLLRGEKSTNPLQEGKDFFLCFSPERVDPGNPTYQTRNIPKVVGGVTEACTEVGVAFYKYAVDTVVPVQGTVTAEMVKLLENTFRMINIGLVNELAIMCDRMGINIWDVIDAAKTKPFGYMPFYPGPGLGGHCIPIDPFYLSWKSKQYGCDPRFIELAGVINGQMPHYVVQKVQDALNTQGKPVKGARIHISGVAYKKDIDDVRESPAVDIAHLLIDKGAILTYHDPYIPEFKVNGYVFKSEPLTWDSEGREYNIYETSDCVVIATDHSCIDYGRMLWWSKLVIDTRNALGGIRNPKIVRL